MKKSLVARSEYAKTAASAYRNAANLVEAGEFEKATEHLKLGNECLTVLAMEIKVILQKRRKR